MVSLLAYPSSFHFFGDHDDDGAPLLPNHAPEVDHGVGQGSLGCNVAGARRGATEGRGTRPRGRVGRGGVVVVVVVIRRGAAAGVVATTVEVVGVGKG